MAYGFIIFFIPLSLSYLFHLLLQLFTSISTLSHISFFFSFNYSLPPSPLSHTLSSSLAPFVRSILSVLSLMLPIRCSLFLRVADFLCSISELLIRCSQSRRFAALRVAEILYHRQFAVQSRYCRLAILLQQSFVRFSHGKVRVRSLERK